MNLQKIENENIKKQIPDELKEFNWGAFLLTFIWGIKYKAWITLLAIPLIFIQIPFGFNWLLFTALQIYCGIKGNEWAYQVEWWKKPVDFRNTQIKWAIFAVAINILIPLSLLTILAAFVSKSAENPIEYMQNVQCTIAYKKLKSGIKKIPININTTTFEIANNFARSFKNTRVEDNSVVFQVKTKSKKFDSYNINFYKTPDSNCNLIKENCIARSSYIIPADMFSLGECIFYFDEYKKVKPSYNTQKAINKGFNIFKYL